jgi:hypothetical protein
VVEVVWPRAQIGADDEETGAALGENVPIRVG